MDDLRIFIIDEIVMKRLNEVNVNYRTGNGDKARENYFKIIEYKKKINILKNSFDRSMKHLSHGSTAHNRTACASPPVGGSGAERDTTDNCSIFKRLDESELSQWLDDYSLLQLWEKNVLGGQP
jgi:hypothetical protein